MKNSRTRKSSVKKAAKSMKHKQRSALTPKVKGRNASVNQQPRVTQQAAVAHGMFLYTNDAWSLQYFDQNDLHFKEREVFG